MEKFERDRLDAALMALWERVEPLEGVELSTVASDSETTRRLEKFAALQADFDGRHGELHLTLVSSHSIGGRPFTFKVHAVHVPSGTSTLVPLPTTQHRIVDALCVQAANSRDKAVCLLKEAVEAYKQILTL